MPDEQHGDDRHLVNADMKAAAAASGITVEQAWTNVQKSMASAKPNGDTRQPAMASAKTDNNAGQGNASSNQPGGDNRQQPAKSNERG